jgi:hypothetical protein
VRRRKGRAVQQNCATGPLRQPLPDVAMQERKDRHYSVMARRRSIHDCFNIIDPSQTYVGFFHSIPRRAPESENRSEAENTGLMLVAVLDPILIIGCSTSR